MAARRTLRSLGRLLRGLEMLALPPLCLACGALSQGPIAGLCPGCSEHLPWRADLGVLADPASAEGPPVLAFVSCFYEDPLTRLVQGLKYGGRRQAAVVLAALLERPLEEASQLLPLDLLVPVPTHALKVFTRGLDHTRLLAEDLGRRLRLPVRSALRRRRRTVALSQAGSAARRRRALEGAFAGRSPRGIHGARVGLVDDLVTTGQTAAACARELYRHGAGRVLLLAPCGNVSLADPVRLSPRSRRSGSRP